MKMNQILANKIESDYVTEPKDLEFLQDIFFNIRYIKFERHIKFEKIVLVNVCS